jgi:formylglycine-generating enzyme required for sulfatase activity
VSWKDSQEYLAWLSRKTGEEYRLLSEAEWEYVARAGTTTPFNTGATISTSQANYDGNYVYGSGSKGQYRKKTVPVGSFAANRFGLHDVHGNLWEMTQDCWNDSYSNAGRPNDGSAWEQGDCTARVARGGSWGEYPSEVRSAVRSWQEPFFRLSFSGFRVARTVSGS